MQRLLPRSTMVALAGLVGLGWPAAGQERVVLRGEVIHAASREPLPGALVTAPLAGLRVLTDSTGGFSLSMIEDRGYRLVIDKMGFHTLRITLAPEAAESSTTIPLPPDTVLLAGLAALQERLEQRRRRAGRSVRLIEQPDLLMSSETSVYDLVSSAVSMAVVCSRRPEELCRLGGSRIRICLDDQHLTGGANELHSWEPEDLWLVELYNRGERVRLYSRWFVDRVARTRQGELPLNPVC